eukprot:1299873-Amorphochlora_amoeboformis.AAC.1
MTCAPPPSRKSVPASFMSSSKPGSHSPHRKSVPASLMSSSKHGSSSKPGAHFPQMGGASRPRSDRKQSTEEKRKRIKFGLREMMCRFDMKEEFYDKLTDIVATEYPSNDDRVKAVKKQLEIWKEKGILALRRSP